MNREKIKAVASHFSRLTVHGLLNLLFPSVCPVCGNDSDSHRHNPVCASCWNAIGPYSGPACLTCGIPVTSDIAMHCESCMKTPPSFSKVIYYGIYDGTLRKAIHLLKFNGVKRLALPVAELLSELPLPEADGIVPVPLHSSRLREREFNQTALISRHLARHSGIPLLLDVLKKCRETPPQTDVTGKQRLGNVKNAFTVSKDVQGLRIIIVDDVITTGATVNECAKVLTRAGAENVTVLALARSVPKHN